MKETWTSIEVVTVRDDGLGNASYLVHLGEGRAAVVDPARDPTPYLRHAARQGWKVVAALETHLHADFVTGSRELAHHGASIFAPAAGRLEFPHRGLEAGDELQLEAFTIRALPTPGHTPEHLAYLVGMDGRPEALFSGGSLLSGSVARTDLIAPDRTEELARLLFRSLRDHVLPLPDRLPVLPTHGAGSFCTVGGGGQHTTTLGRERATNPLLQIEDEDRFVDALLAGYGSYPPYFLRLREVNRRGPRVYGEDWPGLDPRSPTEVQQLMERGAALVDVRPVQEFAAGHVPGALSIALRPAFASWLGWLVDPDQEVVFVLGAAQDRRELATRCLGIGYERLAGELEGGVGAWRAAGLPLRSVSLVSPAKVQGDALIDVRQHDELAEGRIPDAVHVELGEIAGARLPEGRLVLHCGHGERAMSGASLLAARGREAAVMLGGPAEWSRATGRSTVLG